MKKTKIFILALMSLTLTSCSFTFDRDGSSSNSSNGTEKTTSDGTTSQGTTSENTTNKDTTSNGSTSNPTTETSSTTSEIKTGEGFYKASLNDINLLNYNYYYSYPGFPSTGASANKRKMLVIPVDFTDYLAKDKLGGEESSRTTLSNVFFGDSSVTGWESLKSYYYKSSYGQIELDGVVTPWFHANYTREQLGNLTAPSGMSNGDYYDPSWTILEQAVEYARTTLKIDLTQYDSNQDSVIDGVWLVYSFKENDSNVPGNVAWAYTYCDYSKESAYFNSKYLASPVGYHYCWASYNFAVSATGYGYNSAKPDVHTYAHETGHLMGLNDYYNTSDSDDCNNAGVSEVPEGVAGGNIMMDCNIGDHDAFSKFSLNWVSPYVIDGTAATTTISIKPFEENGDCILLRNTSSDPWNGKVFDEYLLIDYYTPSNLQQKDTIGYDNGYNTYNSSGIRVYHVDSRLINEHTSNGKETYSYVDTYESSDENDYAFIAAGNSQVGSVDQTGSKLSKARQLSLIDASNKSTYSGTSFDSSYGNDNVLFQVGDTFSMSKYAKYFKVNSGKFNDGTTLGYTFKIDDLGDEATLTFTKA